MTRGCTTRRGAAKAAKEMGGLDLDDGLSSRSTTWFSAKRRGHGDNMLRRRSGEEGIGSVAPGMERCCKGIMVIVAAAWRGEEKD